MRTFKKCSSRITRRTLSFPVSIFQTQPFAHSMSRGAATRKQAPSSVRIAGSIPSWTIRKHPNRSSPSIRVKKQMCKTMSLDFLFFLCFSEGKYDTLVKNVYFYLSYVSLEIGDYAGCIRNGNELLRRFAGKLTAKTEFSCK